MVRVTSTATATANTPAVIANATTHRAIARPGSALPRRRPTKLSSRGRSESYESQKANVRPPSAAAPGSSLCGEAPRLRAGNSGQAFLSCGSARRSCPFCFWCSERDVPRSARWSGWDGERFRPFRLVTWSLMRSKGALGAYLRRQRSRLGAPKAITAAAAHKPARIVYHLVAVRRGVRQADGRGVRRAGEGAAGEAVAETRQGDGLRGAQDRGPPAMEAVTEPAPQG